MATERPETIDAASFRTEAQRRMPAGNFLGLREEWANRGPRAVFRAGWKAQGKKVERRHCGQAIEAQPVSG